MDHISIKCDCWRLMSWKLSKLSLSIACNKNFNVSTRAVSIVCFIPCICQRALINWKMIWHLVCLAISCLASLFLKIETSIVSLFSTCRCWTTLQDRQCFSCISKNTCLITHKCLMLKIHNCLRRASSRCSLTKEQCPFCYCDWVQIISIFVKNHVMRIDNSDSFILWNLIDCMMFVTSWNITACSLSMIFLFAWF